MKRAFVLTAIAVLLVGLVGYAGFAGSNATKTAAHQCSGQCGKFVDANNDGVCDLAAQCHQSGQCDPNCAKHAKDTKSASSCPPACASKCKATCGGHR